MVTEVEVRTFISEQEYHKLLKFFNQKATLLTETDQETWYFDCKEDFRIQKGKDYAKLWLKRWEFLDDHCEEIEVMIKPEEFEKAAQLFADLGYQPKVKWFRHRCRYDWHGILASVDHTRGFWYILELEIKGKQLDKTASLQRLKQQLKHLVIKETPKEKFLQRYEYYKANWKKVLGEDN